jgi:hypothetical protein
VLAAAQVGEFCWVSIEADPGGGVRSIAGPLVRPMTIHAAKGLEFPAVIVTAVDQLPRPIEPDEVRDGNLLRGGMIRAIDHLLVNWSGRSFFTDRGLRTAKAAEFIPDHEPMLEDSCGGPMTSRCIRATI